MKKGFTLIEMLVVMGIIAILAGASIAGFSHMTKTAERAKAQELVSNVATALTALFQTEGNWPQALISKNGGQLDAKAAFVLAKKGYLSLTLNSAQTQLAGQDAFGVVTPWALAAIKRAGKGAQETTVVNSQSTVKDHILYFALDLDGDGIIRKSEAPSVGGEKLEIRATAVVWCIGKSGGQKGQPWPYSLGRRKDDVYSWTYGQTQYTNK